MPDDKYVIEVEWDAGDLPRLVGPFDNRNEADRWGMLNITNASWNVAPLAFPYHRNGGA